MRLRRVGLAAPAADDAVALARPSHTHVHLHSHTSAHARRRGARVHVPHAHKCTRTHAPDTQECTFKPQLTAYVPEGSSSALFLGPACPLPATAIEPLFDGQRWRRLPAAVAAAGLGFARMAWVTPSEFLGDTIYSKSGGLALLHDIDDFA